MVAEPEIKHFEGICWEGLGNSALWAFSIALSPLEHLLLCPPERSSRNSVEGAALLHLAAWAKCLSRSSMGPGG